MGWGIVAVDIIGLGQNSHGLTQAWDNMGKENFGMVQGSVYFCSRQQYHNTKRKERKTM